MATTARTIDIDLTDPLAALFPDGLTPSQNRIFRTTATEISIEGAVRSGKTEGGLAKALCHAFWLPGVPGFIGRYRQKDVRSKLVPHLFRLIDRLVAHLELDDPRLLFPNWAPSAEFRRRDDLTLHVCNGSEIRMDGLRDYRAEGGGDLGWVMFDEVTGRLGYEALDEDGWSYLLTRLSYPLPQYPQLRQIWGCMNPPPPRGHWVAERFPEEGAPGREVIRVDIEENRAHLPEGVIEMLERQITDPDMRAVFLRGERGAVYGGKPVLKGFSRRDMARSLSYEPTLPVYEVWDFGYQVCAVTWHQLAPGPQWRVLREYLVEQAHLGQVCEDVLALRANEFPGAEVRAYGDIAGEAHSDTDRQSRFDVLRTHGIQAGRQRIRSIEESANGVEEWINRRVRGEPAFVIDESCTHTIAGLSGAYRYAERLDGSMVERRIYQSFEAHPCDTLRILWQNLLKREGIQVPAGRGSYAPARKKEGPQLVRLPSGGGPYGGGHVVTGAPRFTGRRVA